MNCDICHKDTTAGSHATRGRYFEVHICPSCLMWSDDPRAGKAREPKNMSTSIKLINSLSVLLIGYLKLFLKQKVTKMKIKAYAWDDEDYGGSYFVWTTTPGKAKALLAAEHDREFTEIRVYRVPWADKYGDNKIIPAKELLSNGWWLYCSNCGTRVQNDTATVLDAVEVLCDECAKDWNEKRGKNEDRRFKSRQSI